MKAYRNIQIALFVLFAIAMIVLMASCVQGLPKQQSAPQSIVLAPGESVIIYAATLPAQATITPTLAPTETFTETPVPPSDTPTSTDTLTPAPPTPTLTPIPPTDTPTGTTAPTDTPTLIPTSPPHHTPVISSTIPIVNVPYLGAAPPVNQFTPAVFWFGKVEPTTNSSDVRVYYYDNYIGVIVNIIDRGLKYPTSPTAQNITQYDSVS